MGLVNTSLSYQIAPFDEKSVSVRPTLILLHGRGANEEDLLGLVPYLDPNVLCIAARAPFEFSYGGYMWYDLEDIRKPNMQQFVESHLRLCQFLDDVQKNHPVDPQRTFLLGFSMGSVMSYALALTMPERIRGVIAHSGYIPENTPLKFKWESLKHTLFFVAHGILDPIIPIEFGRKARELLQQSGAQLDYREYPIQHQISEESLRDLSKWLGKHLESPPQAGQISHV